MLDWLRHDPLGRLYLVAVAAAWFAVCVVAMRGGLS